jgi:L-ascorbate metabolism protein UlaG (beta-lactamase superfamily)
MMQLQLLRNATLLLQINGKKILVDPMLAPAGSYPALPNTANTIRNPTVDLPVDAATLVADVDAVLLTHLHRDHWDELARELLPKDIPLLCQPVSMEELQKQGFIHLLPVADSLTWEGITVHRTGGRHGTGEIGERMGVVSGFVIDGLYIAGDTIWCEEVKAALDTYQPKHIVVNGGAARFVTGGPIIMSIEDIKKVRAYAPLATLYVVHLEAVNHVTESREAIKKAIPESIVPEDGEVFLK